MLVSVVGGRARRRRAQRRLDHRPARAGGRLLPGARLGVAITIPQLATNLGVAPFVLFVVGGVLYTVGAVIYATRRPNPWPPIFGFHEIFHAFVIAAAIAHFVAMAGWVIPAG